jgi:dTDP-4-dehydrorhamnose 3,5-epimerase
MNLRKNEMKHAPGQTGALFFGLPLIINSNGNLRHIFKSEPGSTLPFSEIYFSEVNPKSIKAWKHHSLQTQNISVAFGQIRIICVSKKPSENIFEVFDLNSEELFGILTIPTGIYYALINRTDRPTVLLNTTDIVYNPVENHSLPLDYLDFQSLINEYRIYK